MKGMRLLFFIIVLLVAGIGYIAIRHSQRDTGLTLPQINTQLQEVRENTPADTPDERPPIEVIASDLNIPWEIVFLPDGGMMVTERPGRVLLIHPDLKIIEISGVTHVGEGGLMGMVLHPDFATNKYVYLYYTTTTDGALANRVSRYTMDGSRFTDETVVLSGIAGARNHDGGRIAFGPDGYLYVTTGDAQNEGTAQDTNSLNGKILRITDEGNIPSDNPFGNAVYSMGHRNPQGLAWDAQGTLWATEHGPSIPRSGWDEVNLITSGANYGWPTVRGEQTGNGLTPPIVQSGSSETWAPAGAAFYDGTVYFGGLRGEALYAFDVQTHEIDTYLDGQFGRIRAVVLGPDNYLYITTSNTDGRGSPIEADDRIVRIDPKRL